MSIFSNSWYVAPSVLHCSYQTSWLRDVFYLNNNERMKAMEFVDKWYISVTVCVSICTVPVFFLGGGDYHKTENFAVFATIKDQKLPQISSLLSRYFSSYMKRDSSRLHHCNIYTESSNHNIANGTQISIYLQNFIKQ